MAFAPQVEELRRDLRIKSQELEVKNAAANDKLKKMVKDQQEAEKKKVLLLVPGTVACVGRTPPSRGFVCACVRARVCVWCGCAGGVEQCCLGLIQPVSSAHPRAEPSSVSRS